MTIELGQDILHIHTYFRYTNTNIHIDMMCAWVCLCREKNEGERECMCVCGTVWSVGVRSLEVFGQLEWSNDFFCGGRSPPPEFVCEKKRVEERVKGEGERVCVGVLQ